MLSFHEIVPSCHAPAAAGIKAVVGAGSSFLIASSITALQSGGISAVSSLAASFFTAHVFGCAGHDFDDRARIYYASHILAVPLVVLAAELVLGWSISLPTLLLLIVSNTAASVLDVFMVPYIRQWCFAGQYSV